MLQRRLRVPALRVRQGGEGHHCCLRAGAERVEACFARPPASFLPHDAVAVPISKLPPPPIHLLHLPPRTFIRCLSPRTRWICTATAVQRRYSVCCCIR